MAKKKTPSADSVGGMLKSLMLVSRAVDEVLEKRAVESATGGPLAVSKVKLLRLLGERGGQTSTRVARFLGVTKPAVSQIIDSMAQGRLVVRKRAKEDRREVNLELTKLGRSKFQAIRRGQRDVLRSVMRSVRRPGAKDLIAGLQQMAVALAQANGDADGFCLQCGAHSDGTCALNGEAECTFLAGGCRETAGRRSVVTKKKRPRKKARKGSR